MGKPSLAILESVKAAREKQADPTADAFSGALQSMAAGQLRSDALRDVGNVGLTALGVGAAGRGVVGLLQALRAGRPKKTRSGPAYLPMPFPAAPEKAGLDVSRVLSALGGLGRKAGGVVGQGVKDVKLGLGVGPEARQLANLTQSVRGSHRALAEGVSDAGTVGSSASLPGGMPDLRVPGSAGDAVGHLAANHSPAKVSGMYSALDQLTRSQDRGTNLLTAGGLAAAGATGHRMGKQADFLAGDAATTKSGIPWYGPAMLLGGLGGLGVGWKGMDALIDARRKKEMEGELESARSQFHDALMSQYSKPVKMHPGLIPGADKEGADSTMTKVGQALDVLWEKLSAALAEEENRPTAKQAFDLSNAAGQLAGGYGMYAGLSGLLSGALVYDKMQKRSRRAVLESALKKRQRRRFMQQPTEIYAQPEPVPAG